MSNTNPLLGESCSRLSVATIAKVLNTDYSIEDFERLAQKMELMHGLAVQDLHHHYGDGVYVRELRVPKGSLVIGEIHKYRHISIMVSGKMLMWTSVKGVSIVEGPMVTITPAGCKRVGYAVTDTIFMTAHGIPDFGNVEPNDKYMRTFLASKTLKEYQMFCRGVTDATCDNHQPKIRSE